MERGLVLFLTAPAHAADFSGLVVSVLDGDTIEVLHNPHPERIRLSGIDCPEKGQAFGTRAKQAASALVFGRDVTLHTHGQDKYRRTLADDGKAMRFAFGVTGSFSPGLDRALFHLASLTET